MSTALVTRLPSPNTALPEEGILEVLKHAAHANPGLTLILVLTFIVVLYLITCRTAVAFMRYFVLKDPIAAKTIRAIEQDERLVRGLPKKKPATRGRK
ncbi:MAG: hypothetical protein A3E01_15470 [Gammaproteobacteria bacterium RIFCSPHIGHO2_12_FULL_63_22]|nr:MAG: hypothetical protein A3E01_15470 [Gammaproteobacteria bacterium RIFCSPHIGHO2_12_FULL_63_22]